MVLCKDRKSLCSLENERTVGRCLYLSKIYQGSEWDLCLGWTPVDIALWLLQAAILQTVYPFCGAANVYEGLFSSLSPLLPPPIRSRTLKCRLKVPLHILPARIPAQHQGFWSFPQVLSTSLIFSLGVGGSRGPQLTLPGTEGWVIPKASELLATALLICMQLQLSL